jgi:hypothetical protein
METVLRAIEVTGYVDEQRQLHLDELLPVTAPGRVRAIILFSEAPEFDEREWMHAASRNPSFDFLNAPSEDIYTLADGKPFHDHR